MQKNDEVISRDGSKTGKITLATRRCQMEGCNGTRYYVRWNDGRATYPCSKSLAPNGANSWRLL